MKNLFAALTAFALVFAMSVGTANAQLTDPEDSHTLNLVIEEFSFLYLTEQGTVDLEINALDIDAGEQAGSLNSDGNTWVFATAGDLVYGTNSPVSQRVVVSADQNPTERVRLYYNGFGPSPDEITANPWTLDSEGQLSGPLAGIDTGQEDVITDIREGGGTLPLAYQLYADFFSAPVDEEVSVTYRLTAQ